MYFSYVFIFEIIDKDFFINLNFNMIKLNKICKNLFFLKKLKFFKDN